MWRIFIFPTFGSIEDVGVGRYFIMDPRNSLESDEMLNSTFIFIIIVHATMNEFMAKKFLQSNLSSHFVLSLRGRGQVSMRSHWSSIWSKTIQFCELFKLFPERPYFLAPCDVTRTHPQMPQIPPEPWEKSLKIAFSLLQVCQFVCFPPIPDCCMLHLKTLMNGRMIGVWGAIISLDRSENLLEKLGRGCFGEHFSASCRFLHSLSLKRACRERCSTVPFLNIDIDTFLGVSSILKWCFSYKSLKDRLEALKKAQKAEKAWKTLN